MARRGAVARAATLLAVPAAVIAATTAVMTPGSAGPSAAWRDRYTAQMLHVWVVPHPGGVFSDDLSAAATSAAVHTVLAEHG